MLLKVSKSMAAQASESRPISESPHAPRQQPIGKCVTPRTIRKVSKSKAAFPQRYTNTAESPYPKYFFFWKATSPSQASQNLTSNLLWLCVGGRLCLKSTVTFRQTGSSTFFALGLMFNLMLVRKFEALSTVMSSDLWVTDALLQLWDYQIQSFLFCRGFYYLVFVYIWTPKY